MRPLPWQMRRRIGCPPRANDAISYLLLQQDFAELFPRQLPDDAFHLQIRKRNQNFKRVQAGPFDGVINVHRFVCRERFDRVSFSSHLAMQLPGDSAARPPVLGLQECRADGRRQFFDHARGASHKLGRPA